MENEDLLAKGLCERIGIDGALTHETSNGKVKSNPAMPDHTAAIQVMLDALLDSGHGVIKNVNEIHAVGHRVVHGGEEFTSSVIISIEVEKAIEACADMAPLHNPPNLTGIRACKKLMPNVPQAAVFDTAFHQTMPSKAFSYALPHELYDKYKIRKYGFHGTSHMYVSQQAAILLNKPLESLKTVTCHLGNGSSVCAVDGGKSVDTSMGFTPLEGLAMGTRCGDIDTAVVPYIMEKENLTASQVVDLLNKNSGMLGLSGVSSDFRDLADAVNGGNALAGNALDVFCYRVAGYVGRYAAAMKGADAVVFTAGVGENDVHVREVICSYLEWMGVAIDAEKNSQRGKSIDISKPDAKVRVLVIPTNEELMIARDTKRLTESAVSH
jgi:acetate kinase